jgi:arylsulfatase A-like enzyme
VDTHLGRLFDAMERQGVLDKTLVIFTADHGDLLGDHWLGEKELFYDCVQRVPLIVVDPAAAADGTRGTADARFAEAVDILPTMLDALGMLPPAQRIEGRSLLGLTRGHADAWRDAAFSELDYSFRGARLSLGKSVTDCRAFSVRTARWRYVYWIGEPEQLYDLQADPDEFVDLGRDPAFTSERDALRAQLMDWLVHRRHRDTVSDAFVESRTNTHKKAGVFYGQW